MVSKQCLMFPFLKNTFVGEFEKRDTRSYIKGLEGVKTVSNVS